MATVTSDFNDLAFRACLSRSRAPCVAAVESAKSWIVSAAVLAGDRPVQLVLHGGEKVAGDGGVAVVVGREGVDVGDFLVEATLTGADLADALQQLIEVILAKSLCPA